jgi:hypothetical protein
MPSSIETHSIERLPGILGERIRAESGDDVTPNQACKFVCLRSNIDMGDRLLSVHRMGKACHANVINQRFDQQFQLATGTRSISKCRRMFKTVQDKLSQNEDDLRT